MTPLSLNDIRSRCSAFASKWADASDEDADAKSFWDDLFSAFGANRRQVAKFEHRIKKLDGNYGFIDLLWKGTLVVEHKSLGKDLAAAADQALDYIERLKPSDRPRYLVTCDFFRFEVHDLREGRICRFTLPELPEHAEELSFIAGYVPKRPSTEAPVNVEAVERLGALYDEMRRGGYPDHDLQEFLVRILFCLFAEDTGVFEPDAFTEIILNRTSEDGSDLGVKLAHSFQTLNLQLERRQKALDESLAALPYVNGALFARPLSLAAMDAGMRSALVRCTEFDWSKISPAIFGSLFQGVMDPAERRAAGAHYTAEDNILKVLQPLFLDALQSEFTAIKNGPATGRQAKLRDFHEKLAKLRILDPACGCGNFLIVAYRELRRLEIEVLKQLHTDGQAVLDVALLSKLDVDQFYGIEIDEFPAQIARVALWLMDHVMNVELGYTFGKAYTRLPLTKSANIIHGNALRLNWEEIISPQECSYILGNPPFIGKQYQTADQKADMAVVMSGTRGSGVLDFVTCWYVKAAAYIQGTSIQCAFVSTNSITQGEQACLLWPHLFQYFNLRIHFAHRTFAWQSEARGQAHVHVVIIGFACVDSTQKTIFDYELDPDHPSITSPRNISPYLVEGGNFTITKTRDPVNGAPPIAFGSMPNDGGHLILTAEEKDDFVKREPNSEKWIRQIVGSLELIRSIKRYCLWLVGITPQELRSMPEVMARIAAVKATRLQSRRSTTNELANSPALFGEIRQPEGAYLAIPEVSSEKRRYIPIAWLPATVISTNKVYTMAGATLYNFGIVTSSMHMAWMRQIGGRLKSDYQYSAGIVYNTFPWPTPTNEQEAKIEQTAQKVLDARAEFPEATLADLYDPNSMPPVLTKAHAELDRAVERAYRAKPFSNDRERGEYLFALYKELVDAMVDE